MKKRKFVSRCLVMLVLFLPFCTDVAIISEGSSIQEPYRQEMKMAYTPHDPIDVQNNSAFTPSGFTGSGVEGDPYVLEGKSITTDSDCVIISGTDAHFVIRNCILQFLATTTNYGVAISLASNGLVDSCTIENKANGVYVSSSENVTIYNTTIFDNQFNGIYIEDSNHINVTDCIVYDNGYRGVQLDNSPDCLFVNNTIYQNSDHGLYAYYSDDCTVIRNTIYDNGKDAMFLFFSNRCTVLNNTVYFTQYYGIYLHRAHNSTVMFNRVNDSALGYPGLHVFVSPNCVLDNNTITDCIDLKLDTCLNTTFRYNKLLNVGLRIGSFTVEEFNVNVTGTTVNNKPIGHFWNVSDTFIDTSIYGQIYLANCSDVTVQYGSFLNATVGIVVAFSTDIMAYDIECGNGEGSIIAWYSSNCTFVNISNSNDRWNGLYNYHSDNTTLSNSSFTNFQRMGIRIESSDYCVIDNCTVESITESGVYLDDSDFCSAKNNTITDCDDYGVFITSSSSSNSIFWNTIGWNTLANARDDGTSNSWDDGVNKGNAWSDYSGEGVYTITGSASAFDMYPSKADTKSPSIDSPEDFDYEVNTGESFIIWTPYDSHPYYYHVLRNNSGHEQGPWDGSYLNISFDASILTTYNFTIIVNDTSGNFIVDTVFVFVVDTTGPSIDVNIEPISFTEFVIPRIIAYVTDFSSIDLVYLYYSINTQTNWIGKSMVYNVSGFWEESIPGQDWGTTVYYYVYAIDELGNTASSSTLSFTVQKSDTYAPLIEAVTQSPNLPLETDYVDIRADVSDANALIDIRLYYRVGTSGPWESVEMEIWAGLWRGIIGYQNVGVTVYYFISATDSFENTANTTTYSYDVLNSAEEIPTIVSISQDPEIPREGDDVTVTVVITDPDGIDQVNLWYTIGGDHTQIIMSYIGSNQYRGTIPSKSHGIVVSYDIDVTDNNGHFAYSESFYYTVGAAIQTTDGALLPIIIYAGSTAVVIIGIVIIEGVRRRFGIKKVSWKKRVPVIPDDLEDTAEPIEKTVKALRGCEMIGGRFEYKVKVRNDTEFVITNVIVTIMSYPEDCLNMSGSVTKKIKRIGPNEFRSPQFTFTPTKDCVEGKVISTVSYIDHTDDTEVIEVEPYIIRSVCDLLTPLQSSLEEFDLILSDMEVTFEEHVLDWNPEILFTKTLALLQSKNFHIIESNREIIGGEFTGIIRGLAEGKYTGKRVALRLKITGLIDSSQSRVIVEGLGEDAAMLPTTILEIAAGIDSWTCMNCGGPFKTEEVELVAGGNPVECRYCRHIMTINLYKK